MHDYSHFCGLSDALYSSNIGHPPILCIFDLFYAQLHLKYKRRIFGSIYCQELLSPGNLPTRRAKFWIQSKYHKKYLMIFIDEAF